MAAGGKAKASGTVDMSHGAGGRTMQRMIQEIFAAHMANPYLGQGNDGAVMPAPGGRIAMSTDGHVITPLFFPGGDIGALSVHGTVNDVATSGAKVLYLTAGFIIEEGFPLEDLRQIADSMGRAAAEAGVSIVAGDTKVVERGKGDGVFVTTAGVGVVPEGLDLSGDRARPGDRILISGSIGDHGVAILSKRENLEFETEIRSDSAALNGLVDALVAAVTPEHPDGLRCLRDPTRGGLSATLNELAHQSGVGMSLEEAAIPVSEAVRGACELMGLDPLNIANEGKLIAICAPEAAEVALAAMRAHPLGREAAIIGSCEADERCFVRMSTILGGERMVDWLAGEALPRIC